MVISATSTRWRATDVYLPTNASKAGLLDETRQFLITYGIHRDLQATRQELVDGALPQRSRDTRVTIVTVMQQRLTRWSPPSWVLDDLIAFAHDSHQPSLQAALLLHVVRQDALLYDVVQHVVVARWLQGDHSLIRADVQRFLDNALSEHPEVDSWSHATREKLAGNVLSILRDYGLLRGREQKQIIEPLIPSVVVGHLARLLHDEGISSDAIPEHPDWRIWLWDAERVRAELASLPLREAES